MGHLHHITQTWNYRQPVFDEADDYAIYMTWLTAYTLTYGLRI